jgi:hypothetical protein
VALSVRLSVPKREAGLWRFTHGHKRARSMRWRVGGGSGRGGMRRRRRRRVGGVEA